MLPDLTAAFEPFEPASPGQHLLLSYSFLRKLIYLEVTLHLYLTDRAGEPAAYYIQRVSRSPSGRRTDTMEIGPKDVTALLARLRQVRLSPHPDFHQGLDGADFALYLPDHHGGVLLQWWSELPPSWGGLRRPLKQLEQLSRLEEFI